MLTWICAFLGVLLIGGIVIFGIGSLRRSLVSAPLMRWFKTVLPPMSDTEREAIAAGDVWFEGELFRGQPNWQALLANPKPTLTDAEKSFLDNQVETLCLMLDEWAITHRQYDLSPEVWNYIKTAGFLGLHVPIEFGGMEFSALASSTIVQKIATKSVSAAISVMVPNSLGPAELITHYGTEEQKKKYLHKLAKGVEMPCFALTAPDAGSDATSITDEGVVCYGDYAGQKNVIGVRLNWSKRYITLAPIATLIGLAVKLYDPDKILGNTKDLGITAILVPRDTPGVEIGNRHYPLEQSFMNGPIRGHDVFLPIDCVIGGQAKIGKGWQMLVECLAAGRGISLPSISTATGKQCYRVTGAYAKIRQQFNLSIGKFEGVAKEMGTIGGYTYMLEATRLLTLSAIDQKLRPSVITAITKYHMTEIARKVINAAMDIHGGRGIMMGPRNYLAGVYEAIPISITVEGANIMTRCLMIYGQGAVRCHPYVLAEMNAVSNPDQKAGLLDFDRALFKHLWYSFVTFGKLKFHSYTGAIFAAAPTNTKWHRYYQWISFFSLALAGTSDIAMLTLGGSLKRKENLSARLGDVLSYLYMASAVLKYDADNGQQDSDKALVKWSLDFCLYNVTQSFLYFYANFPGCFWSTALHFIVLPPWRSFKLPKDALELEISQDMMHPSEFRDRLTEYCFTSTKTTDPVGRVEAAMLKMLAVEPILNKIEIATKAGQIAKAKLSEHKIEQAQALNIINADEAAELREFDRMRLDAIQVDEFSPAEFTGKRA